MTLKKVTVKTEHGFTLVEVMVAAAILATIALTFGAVFFQVNRQSSKSESLAVAENTIKAVQAIFANRDLCDNALRFSGGKIGFSSSPGAKVPINQIMFYSWSGSPTVAFTKGQKLSPNVTLEDISFQEQQFGVGESVLEIESGFYKGKYNIFSGYVTLTFSSPKNSDPAPPPRNLPLVVAVGQTSGTIDFCYNNLAQMSLCEKSGGTYTTKGECDHTIDYNLRTQFCDSTNTNCTSVAGCQNFIVIDGFTAKGLPRCRCEVICGKGKATNTSQAFSAGVVPNDYSGSGWMGGIK